MKSMDPNTPLGENLPDIGHGSFEQVYKAYAPELIGYAARRLESLSEAEDIVQDVFADLWHKKEELLITHSLRAYLYGAVRYKVIDHIRRHVQRSYYADMVRSLHTEEDNATFDHIVYKDLHGLIEAEIGKLPARTKEVFRMSRHGHLSVSEIADTLQVSDQTVKNQLTTALKRLRPSFSKFFFLIIAWWML